jgi:hypothetical protein
MRTLSAVSLLAFGVACEGNPEAPTPGERTILLAYQNNVGGDIEPCG